MERIDIALTGVVRPLPSEASLLLGAFDGIHLGHKALVQEALNQAGPAYALLFSEPLGAFFPGAKNPRVLTSLEDKIRIFSTLGLEGVYVIDANPSFFALSPQAFLSDVIAPLKPSLLIVGEDYTFGRGGEGTVDLLKKSFAVSVCPLLEMEGEKISTHRIIGLLEKGDVVSAKRLLGRPYEIKGRVEPGFGNGHKIGFPTANVALSAPYALPKDGVYAGISYLRGIPYPSIINVGLAPTVGRLKEPLVEAYLDGFQGDCYDETIYVSFATRLRDELVFKSLEELKNQLTEDLSYLRKGAEPC